MTSPFTISSLLFQVIILLFIGLSLGIAWKQARVHLSWLVPLAISQVLGLISTLVSMFMFSYMASRHLPYSRMSGVIVSEQVLYGISSLARLWFAVALFLTLRSQVFAPRQTVPPSTPGSWPPPPSV